HWGRSPAGIRQTAGQFLLDAGGRDGAIGDRPFAERVGKSRVGRDQDAASGVRRRHHLFTQRGAWNAGIENASPRRHRAREDHRVQSGTGRRARIHSYLHGVQTRPHTQTINRKMTCMSMISNLESSQVAQSGLFGWYHQGPPAARKGLWAAALGWMLDGFDVMLYALVLGALLQEFSISTRTAGMLGTLTLVASGLGGVLFGAIADRMGRRTAMIGSILIYSIFTALCGLAQTVSQLAVFRFLLGLGMGGEWTSGAALVSETGPDEHRGKAVAWMQSAWAIGYAGAAIIVALVLPRFGWRVVFLIGLLPALLTLWIRRHVHESEMWLASQKEPARARPSVRDVFFGRFASTTLLLTFLSLTTVF